MKLIPLTDVSQALHPGVTLPWGVRDASGALLLAKGHVLVDERAVRMLLERGVFVDAAETTRTVMQPEVRVEDLTTRWTGLEARLGTVLRSPAEQLFISRVTDSIEKILKITDGNIDHLIFLIMRHDHSRLANYGISHSLHAGVLCSLLSKRLGWLDGKRESAIGAAITMNISMLELQGQLAIAGGRPTDKERQLIQNHPSESGRLLREAGLNDSDWLEAVEQHHEEGGATGYPNKLDAPTDIARLVHFVDCFTAKHSPRTGRQPQPAQQAARDLFVQSKGDPLAALIIKEFGIFPPGCYVKLASGETAVVVRRGAAANAPIVAAITNKNGDHLSLPIRRDTSAAGFAIASTVASNAVSTRVTVDSFFPSGNKS